jgi:hypothetical protein
VRTLGVIALVLIILVVAFVLVVGIRSIPDIRRYLKMRSM